MWECERRIKKWRNGTSDAKLSEILSNLLEDESVNETSKILIGQDLANEALRNQKRTERSKLVDFNLVTTGYSFEGYIIKEYKGIVSGDVVVGTDFGSDIEAGIVDFLGGEASGYCAQMKVAKQAALMQMIGHAIFIGANAIIGVQFSIPILRGTVVGVSVNGTAVVVEPEDRG